MTDAGLLHVAYGCPALHSLHFSATGIADWGVRRPVVLAGPLPGARVVVAAAGAKGWRGGVKAAGAVGAEARAACIQMAARCWLGRWVALGGALGDNFIAGTGMKRGGAIGCRRLADGIWRAAGAPRRAEGWHGVPILPILWSPQDRPTCYPLRRDLQSQSPRSGFQSLPSLSQSLKAWFQSLPSRTQSLKARFQSLRFQTQSLKAGFQSLPSQTQSFLHGAKSFSLVVKPPVSIPNLTR